MAENRKLTSEQIEAIVDDHATEVRRDLWKTTWKTRFPEVWAGGGLGIVIGGIVGAVAAASAAIVAPAAVAAALFLPVVGAFAVGGMLMGIAGSTDVGANVGAQLAEIKMRDRERLLKNPEEVLKEHAAYKQLACERGEYKEHGIPFTKGSKKIYNWKLGLTLAATGLAVGGLLAATGGIGILTAATPFISHAVAAGLGHAAAASLPVVLPKVMTAMTIAAMGTFGSVFPLDFPTITSNTAEFFGNLFSGKFFESKKVPEPDIAIAQQSPSCAPPRDPQITPQEAVLLEQKLAAANQAKSYTQTVTQTATANAVIQV